MSKIKQIIRLRNDGVAIQQISKAVAISRNTVKKYLRLIEVKGYSYQSLLQKEDHILDQLLADPDEKSEHRFLILQQMFPYIKKELTRTGVTRWILWGEYKNKNPDGYSYAHFCFYYREWLVSKKAFMHMEHTPADKMFIDFAGKKLHWVDKSSGEVHDAEIFVAILGYSQLTFIQAVPSQKKEDLIEATENALHYYGGVPRVLVPDNLKSAVSKANKYEAELNADFADFANHYQTCVLPARSYKPRDKALVENAVKIAYSRIYAPLRNRVFYSLYELNQAIKQLQEAHNDQPFQNRKTSRKELFNQQEKGKLLPLATERYEIKEYKTLTVSPNSYVRLQENHNYYSVPYRYIGKKVKLVYSASKVEVFHNKERIAFHKRSKKPYEYITQKDHLPSTHQFVADWNPDKFLSWAEGIDPKVRHYIEEILKSKPYPEQAYRSCIGILSQVKKVGKERLIKAVERATYYNAFNYKTIDRILKGSLDRLDDQETSGQTTLPFHQNIRGPENYN